MAEMGDRLKQAREEAGFPSARQAAIKHGWRISTYSAHENGQNDFDEEDAKQYGRAFKVSAGWLLTGEGSATPLNVIGVKGLVGAGGAIDTGAEQIQDNGDLYEIEVPFPLPEGAFALEVRGDSMLPRYDPGDVIICLKVSDDPYPFLGREVVVQTSDGSRFLKRLVEGGRKGFFDLESLNAQPMRKIRIRWVSDILSTVRAGRWRRLNPGARKRAVGSR